MVLSWQEKLSLSVAKQGTVPKHVAIIMDGNRRYAKQRGMPRYAGHHDGGDKLLECMEWCFYLGVQVLTVYAFSIENFRRGEDEVSAIMNLACKKLAELCDNRELVHRYDLQIRILGNIHQLPADLQNRIEKVSEMCATNKGYVGGNQFLHLN
eukprot:c2802_g1_i1.p1 GENE.c2802_g1_i1~~c2802_g1_i1.p1  ORF type:complete len:153 (-),score=14.86 c2802_g1_i1:13-471(-)